MATTGLAKWAKYFADGDVKTKIKKNIGFVNVYDGLRNIIDQIEEGSEITVSQNDYNPRYRIFYNDNKEGYVSSSYIEKPKKDKGATETLKIYTSSLITLGEDIEFEWNGNKILAKRFKNKDLLKESIIHGLFDNHYIHEELKEDLFSLIKNNKREVHWNAGNDIHELNEVGKYLSETLFALNSLDVYQEVLFPVSSNSRMIDSFLIKNQEVVPVSNKYGKGAKASLFNLFECFQYTEDSEISNFYKLSLDSDSNRHAVYKYGLRTLLKKDYSYQEIFDSIISNTPSKEKDEVAEFIKNNTQNKRIIEFLPNSITSYFCRKIAKRINHCNKSLDLIKETFNSLQIKQLVLNNKLWKKGEIKFSLTNMHDSSFIIYGNKSAINNPYAPHGLLNYEIRDEKGLC
jgi:hypothetical protein